MFKTFVTSAVVSKGYNDTPALSFSDTGNAVRFRIGKKVYDPKAENNQRWVNISVKAFGNVLERIKKMDLKEGSFLNISGTLDEEVWTDEKGKHSQHVIIVSDIEYASGGSKPKSDNQNGNQSQAAPASGQNDSAAPNQGDQDNFAGFEKPFGGTSTFFSKDE